MRNQDLVGTLQKIGLLSTAEGFRNDNRTSGARLLVLRCLEQALDDLFIYHPIRRSGRTGAVIYDDTLRWFASPAQHFLSFEWICAHLGWDADSTCRQIYAVVVMDKPPRLRLQIDVGNGNIRVVI